MTSAVIATSKNAVITFTPLIDPVGAFQLEGFSKEHIMAINDADIVKYEVGNDGTPQISVVATEITGDFSFYANSPTLQNIQLLQTGIQLSGDVVVGTLNVNLPALNKKFAYPNFTFLSSVIGIPLSETAQPVKIKWSSLPAIPLQ